MNQDLKCPEGLLQKDMIQNSALIVVDLQNDFLPPVGSLAVPNGRLVISRINSLLDSEKYHWSLIVATQDWHPKDHISFASQHDVEPFTEIQFKHPLGECDKNGSVITKNQIVWPDHCVQNTQGAELEQLFRDRFHCLLVPTLVVQKGYLRDREYYSCFKDVWGLHDTGLYDYLKGNGITNVIFVGLAYDFCVYNSAIDCADLGFETYVIKDCSESVYPEKEKETDKLYLSKGVQLLTAEELNNI